MLSSCTCFRNTLLLLICFSSASSSSTTATTTTSKEDISSQLAEWTSDIDRVVNKLQHCVKFPALSLSIVKVGQQEVVRNYGVLQVDNPRPVDENTRFCIGSLTKGFTAALLTHLLHENGTYNLDSLVSEVLGDEFQLVSPELTAKTTIRDVLAHRLGVAKYFGGLLLGYNYTRAQIIRRIRYLPQVQPFRSSRVFNNILYVLAGALIEKLSGNGKSKASWWENQVVEHILKPLNMKSTTFADKVADWADNFALPHAQQDGKLVTLRAKVTGNIVRSVGPAASMCTTAKDMTNWLKLLLKNGNGVINDSVIDQLFQISNQFRPDQSRRENMPENSSSDGYGLGWIVGKYRGLKRVFHSGFFNYYYSMVSILPDKGIAIYTNVNGPHLIRCDNGIKALHMYIMDSLLQVNSWVNVSNICSYPQNLQSSPPSKMEVSSDKQQMRFSRRRIPRQIPTTVNTLIKYRGSYEHPFFGTVVISFNQTAQQLQLNYGYYGKALLNQHNRQIFQLHFYGSIWYQSESDDMKLFASRNMFNIQFGNFNRSLGGSPQKLVVFMFDTEAAPIFLRNTF